MQRWERELQLPVHRPRSRERSPVVAFRSEVDAWLACTPIILLRRAPETREEILQQRLILLRAEAKRIEEQIQRLRESKEKQSVRAG